KESGEFVINLTPSSLVEVCDYVGTVTGKKVDKVKKTGLTMIPSKEIAAPSIENSPLSLECKVCDVYSYGSHDMFVADVVAVSVNEELLDEKGKLRLDRSNLLVFAHGEYFTLGKKLGPIGISVKDKKKGKKAKVKPHPKG
ncbi:MAG: flavin reductase family protein, partial [Clostridia bacterium]|nr:flavin reductase family protein [Clostridia bacterium]